MPVLDAFKYTFPANPSDPGISQFHVDFNEFSDRRIAVLLAEYVLQWPTFICWCFCLCR